jgi:aldehyde dehydrogenase (NAD+)
MATRAGTSARRADPTPGARLREKKKELGRLISYEVGKITAEGEGEVQEMIDICDFAVGLSRQLYGKTMHSERPMHRMYEQWHPLGVVGVITAFNFPAAVWAWNAALAAVCGDTVVWKPSPKAPITSVAVQKICDEIFMDAGQEGVMNLVLGRCAACRPADARGERLPLISATGSCAMGRMLGQVVARRMGRSLLELGGNNAIIVWDDADLDLAVRRVLFGAAGTADNGVRHYATALPAQGHREGVHDPSAAWYKQIKVGNPLESGNLMGPLIDRGAVDRMMLHSIGPKEEGAEILFGGHRLQGMPTPVDAMSSRPW